MEASPRNTETIPLTVLDIEHVARVTGLSVPQLQRWDRTGFFHPSRADPNRRRPGSRIYSGNEVLALAAIAKLREVGVPLAELKDILCLLAPREPGEQPVRCFYVVGNQLFLSWDEALAAARENGKQVEPTVIDMSAVTAELEVAIEKLSERLPDEIGKVVRRRAIMRGVPTIAGTRIPTKTIAQFHDDGYSLSWILENFPRLTEKDVQAAIEFESARNANGSAVISAHR